MGCKASKAVQEAEHPPDKTLSKVACKVPSVVRSPRKHRHESVSAEPIVEEDAIYCMLCNDAPADLDEIFHELQAAPVVSTAGKEPEIKVKNINHDLVVQQVITNKEEIPDSETTGDLVVGTIIQFYPKDLAGEVNRLANFFDGIPRGHLWWTRENVSDFRAKEQVTQGYLRFDRDDDSLTTDESSESGYESDSENEEEEQQMMMRQQQQQMMQKQQQEQRLTQQNAKQLTHQKAQEQLAQQQRRQGTKQHTEQMMLQQAQQMMMQQTQQMQQQQATVTPPTSMAHMQAFALKEAIANYALLQSMVAELVAAESNPGEPREELPPGFEISTNRIFLSEDGSGTHQS
jgi:hypothetical protein